MAPIGHISDKIYRAEGIYTERNNEDTICLNKHCIGSRQEKEQKISSTRLGVDKVKAKGWFKYYLYIDLRSSVGLFLNVLVYMRDLNLDNPRTWHINKDKASK